MGRTAGTNTRAACWTRFLVVLIGGKKFTKPGQANPAVWPNDGLSSHYHRGAVGQDVNDPVFPHRRATPRRHPASSCPTWRG